MTVYNVVVGIISIAVAGSEIIGFAHQVTDHAIVAGRIHFPFRLVVLEADIGCNDHLVGRIDPVFHPQVEPVVVVAAAGQPVLLVVGDVFQQVLRVRQLVGSIVGIVEKITAGGRDLFAPEVGIIYAQGIRCV